MPSNKNVLAFVYAGPDPSGSAQIEKGVINRSVVGSGCVVDGATLDHAMPRRAVTVHRDARLEHCIEMERSVIGSGARIRRAIVDQDNHIPPGQRIGFDPAGDRRRFQVTDSDIVVVPAGYFSSVSQRSAPRLTADPGPSSETDKPATAAIASGAAPARAPLNAVVEASK